MKTLVLIVCCVLLVGCGCKPCPCDKPVIIGHKLLSNRQECLDFRVFLSKMEEGMAKEYCQRGPLDCIQYLDKCKMSPVYDKDIPPWKIIMDTNILKY
jgi:hypothetical protein